jgi:hypothetical protein
MRSKILHYLGKGWLFVFALILIAGLLWLKPNKAALLKDNASTVMTSKPKNVLIQNFSPYGDFQAMSLEQLKSLQVKLTYVGVQNAPIATVAFTTAFNTLDLTKFKPFRRVGISYGNDDFVPVETFNASPEEMKDIIDKVAALPTVIAGGVATKPYLSFAMLNTSGGTKAFEAVLNKTDSAELFTKLRLALNANKGGLRKLSEMACSLDIVEAERPIDVSSKVNVTMSGVRLDRASGHFVNVATVKNISTETILGPLSLVIQLQGNVGLFNSDGQTCGTSPQGRNFINVPLSSNTLLPGATAQVKLEFENVDQEAIKPTAKVLAGPGAR